MIRRLPSANLFCTQILSGIIFLGLKRHSLSKFKKEGKMKHIPFIAAIISSFFLFQNCSSPVYVQKDDSVNFSNYHTYTWVTTAKSETDKKTILATLADDELIMMNTYSLALSLVTEPEMIKLLESQQQELKKLHPHIRQYHHAQ